VQVRVATPDDAGAIADIYAPYVRDTTVSFETMPPDADEMRSRVATTLTRFPWLVLEGGDGIKGYAYAWEHGSRAAYRWSADVSLYLDRSLHRKGHGRRIYGVLFDLLAAQGYVNAFAAISLPNPASVAMHEAMGFTGVGVLPWAGFKNGAWCDIGWWHRPLLAPLPQPQEPRPWPDLASRTIEAALGG
jgi:L-amino acid N-acyltransferase YncA